MADVFRGLTHRFGRMGRAGIRQSLFEVLGGEVLDLARRPNVPGWFVSISHTGEFGGWVASRTPVGFDVERVERLRPELIARVSSEAERATAPDPRWLWPAKEAAWKGMPNPPTTIIEIVVTSWDGLAFATAFGHGAIAREADLVFAVFHPNPS